MDLLAQWSKHELALKHQRMRYREPICFNLRIPVEDNVKVYISWTFIDSLDPSKALLNPL